MGGHDKNGIVNVNNDVMTCQILIWKCSINAQTITRPYNIQYAALNAEQQ